MFAYIEIRDMHKRNLSKHIAGKMVILESVGMITNEMTNITGARHENILNKRVIRNLGVFLVKIETI